MNFTDQDIEDLNREETTDDTNITINNTTNSTSNNTVIIYEEVDHEL